MSHSETNIFELLRERYVLPKKVRLFEAFSGIGCQRMAFNRLGIEVEMVGISEIDKFAIQSYMAIHGETKNWGSICDVKGDELPEIDVFTWSFPCTDLSKAGKQKGLINTRSGLVYEVLRILRESNNRPKVLIMENVVDLVQTKFIKQFNEIQAELEQLGYTNYTETMNAKDYGVAQNRDRVFMVSILGDYYYEFPKPFKLEKRLKDYLEYRVEERYYLTETSLAGLNQALERHGQDIDKITDNGKELNVIQYPRGENHGGLISDITSPTVDGAIGARNTALLCLMNEPIVDVVGKVNSSQDGVIVSVEGLSPTHTAGHSNCPKIIEPTICDFRYDEGFRSREEDDISPTLPSTHLGTSSMSGQPFVREQYIVESNAKTELCNKMLETGLYQECDMIRHSYTNDRMEYTEKRTENSEDNNISACMTTRSDTLGIVVNNGGLRIRKLTPLECWRLMGIDDSDFHKASQVCSNSQLYKQAGNGIVVDVFATIVKQMKGDDKE